MDIRDVLIAVEDEITKAMAKHGGMTGRHEAYAVILEELDEFWDEVKKNPAKMNTDTLYAWSEDMRKELIQVAAMAIRAIVDLGL